MSAKDKVSAGKSGKDEEDSEDSVSISSEHPDPEVETCQEGIRKNLQDLDEIRARCNGVVNRDIKVVLMKLRDAIGELVEIATERQNCIKSYSRDYQELKEEMALLRRKSRDTEGKDRKGEEHKEVLEEIKALREEVRALRESGSGKDKGTGQDKGTGKGNTARTYADTVGKRKAETHNTGKETGRGVKEVKSRIAANATCGKKQDRVEVIRVRSKEEFPALIKKIRKDTAPAQKEVSVLSVKKDEQGNMLLRVQGKPENRDRFREELGKCIGEKGRMTRVQRRDYIHLSNLDMVTTTEEIEERIGEETGLPREEVMVTSLRPAYGQTQKATVKIPREAAEDLNRKGKIKIGMVAARVNIRIFETRCYKCGGAGHFAGKCTDTGSVGRCFRCGKQGHLARECEVAEWRDTRTGVERQKIGKKKMNNNRD